MHGGYVKGVCGCVDSASGCVVVIVCVWRVLVVVCVAVFVVGV